MSARKQTRTPRSSASTERYAHIAGWVQDGWVEIGRMDGGPPSFVRALDEGGVVWEGAAMYSSLDDALAALDVGLAARTAGEGIA